jgi:hypothetical protein
LRAALDLHAQDGALPGRQQKFREIMRREGRGDLACGLRLRDAGGERCAPFREDGGEPFAQHVALRRGLEAEIADQAAAREVVGREAFGDDVEVAPQALAR